MAVGVEVDEVVGEVVVRLSGADGFWALKRELHLPFDEITRARVVSRSEAKAGLGWRVGGTYWPGRIAAGHYTVKGRKGARQLWSVYRASRVLMIDTTRERPCRVVLELPGQDDLARRIDGLARGPERT